MRGICGLIVVSIALSACGRGFPAQECLQSARLDFKDPDSLRLVAVTGSRTAASAPLTGREDSFWIRYSATNGYGGRVSGNMACERTADGKWQRSELVERMATTAAYIQYLDEENVALEALNRKARECNDSQCINELLGPSRNAGSIMRDSTERATKRAREHVLESPGPLAFD